MTKRATKSKIASPVRARKKRTPTATPRRVTQHPQCAQCLPAKCCRYFSIQIDTPRSKRDFDDLIWMIAHRQVSIYIEKRKWFLMIHTQCRFLDTDTNKCAVYETRPEMCRDHSVKDCEWHGPYDFDNHFKSYEDLKRWMKKRGLS